MASSRTPTLNDVGRDRRHRAVACVAVWLALALGAEGCASATPATRERVNLPTTVVGSVSDPSTTTALAGGRASSSTTSPTSASVSTLPQDLAASLRNGHLPVAVDAADIDLGIHIEVRVKDIAASTFEQFAMTTLADPRSWGAAGVHFHSDPTSPIRLVLAEPAEVDRLCAPLTTGGKVSCQNGTVVAVNADRWRSAVPHWNTGLPAYRQYVINHEVGHVFGMRHPTKGCATPGHPSAVMAQQTKSLQGCTATPFPLAWEIALASQRPAHIAPPPAWGPGPPPTPPPGS